MRIALVVPEYPPHNIGGGGTVFQNIARVLSKRGYDVTVFSGYYQTKFCFEKVYTTYDGRSKVIWLPLIPTFKASLPLETVMPPNIFSALCLLKMLLKENFDVVHLHGFGHLLIDFVALFCSFIKKKYILTVHGIPKSPLEGGKLVRLLYGIYLNTIGRFVVRKAKIVTSVSEAVARELKARFQIERVKVIPNGVNKELTEFKLSRRDILYFERRYNISKDDILLLCIGRMSWNKGYEYLIQALPLLRERNTIIMIIGPVTQQKYYEYLRELSKKVEREYRVIFTGYRGLRFRALAMERANIVVIPSLYETFGLVALEAMAMSKPIVASKVEGLSEVLENEKTALLVEPKNSEELARAIIRLIRDFRLREMLSNNAKQKAANFDWETVVNEYMNVYKRFNR
jgi:glycosyltransferase involved in cell wall biosynthesis